MIYLVDTNVLLRSVQANDPTYELARRSVASLTGEGHRLSVIAQNLIEFWVVATRPALNNGLALSISDTVAHINRFRETLRLLPDSPAIFPEWQRLAEAPFSKRTTGARRTLGGSYVGTGRHPSPHV